MYSCHLLSASHHADKAVHLDSLSYGVRCRNCSDFSFDSLVVLTVSMILFQMMRLSFVLYPLLTHLPIQVGHSPY